LRVHLVHCKLVKRLVSIFLFLYLAALSVSNFSDIVPVDGNEEVVGELPEQKKGMTTDESSQILSFEAVIPILKANLLHQLYLILDLQIDCEQVNQFFGYVINFYSGFLETIFQNSISPNAP